jgi:hypothetical protein
MKTSDDRMGSESKMAERENSGSNISAERRRSCGHLIRRIDFDLYPTCSSKRRTAKRRLGKSVSAQVLTRRLAAPRAYLTG